MRIERVDMASPKPLPTPETMVEAMDWAGDLRHRPDVRLARIPLHLRRRRRPSTRTPFRAVGATDADAKRGRAAANMYWELAPDEALIVEFDAHDGLWMLTNMGVFLQQHGLPLPPGELHAEPHEADGDGKCGSLWRTMTPAFHNWLDTQGFERGNLTYRHMLEGEPAVLNTRSSSGRSCPTRCHRTPRR